MERRMLVPPTKKAMPAVRVVRTAAAQRDSSSGGGSSRWRKKMMYGATGKKMGSRLTMAAIGAGWTPCTHRRHALCPR